MTEHGCEIGGERVEEPEAHEARYRRFVETALEGIWAMNPEHETTFVNERMASMLGYTPSQMLGHKVEDFMFEEDLPAHRQRMQSRHKGKGGQYEHRFRRADGREVWTLVSATAIVSEQGQFGGSFAMFTDITERKRAIRALERSEQRYRALFEGSPVGIGMATLEGHVLIANRAMEELFGYSAQELEHLDIADLYEDPNDRIALLKHIERKGYVRNLPVRARRKDGQHLDILISSSRIQSEGRALLQTMCVDVTERKQAEQALRLSHDCLELAGRCHERKALLEGFLAKIREFTGCGRVGIRLLDEADKGRTRNVCNETSCESVGLVPIRMEGRILGLIHVADARENRVPRSVIEALETVGRELGVSLRRIEVEETLRQSESRFASAFDYAAIGMAIVSPEGRWLRANRAVLDMLGYTEEDLLARTFQSITHPDDLDADMACVRRMLAGELRTCQMEKRYFHKMGHIVWALVSVSLVRDERGKPLHFISQIQDITERRRAEGRLRTASEMLDTAPSSITVHDFEGRFLFANRKTFEIHGYEEHEFMALDLHQLDVPASEALIAERMERIAAEGVASFEVEHFRKDGSTFPLEIYVKQVMWEGVPAILSIGTDITERKRAREALGRQRAELQAIYDHAPVMMCVLDRDRQVLYANRAFTEFTGVSENELTTGRACGVFGCINAQADPRGCGFGPACERCELRRALEDTLRTGVGHRDIDYRATLEQASGRRDVVLLGATAAIHMGERSNVLLCLEDRTEQEQAEQRTRQRELELLHVARLSTLGEMASGLAHELSQPLSAIVNYSTACAQLGAADRPDLQRIVKNIHRITEQAERARDIMARIRELAQRRRPRLTSVDVNQVIAAALDLLSWQIRQKGIDLNVVFDDRLPAAWADVVQIEQVLVNLIRNAIEAMEQTPSQHRHLTIRTGADDRGTVRIEVCDTGVGIPRDNPDRIFDAFFTTKADGLGMGLPISRTIVEMHEGTLQADRNAEGGSTFVVVLPRASKQDDLVPGGGGVGGGSAW